MKRIALLFLLTSCVKTEIINEYKLEEDIFPMKQKKEFVVDTLQVDTTRVPISFNPSVEDWEDDNIDV